MVKLEARVSELERSSSRHHREIAAIRKLLIQGAKIIVRIEKGLDDLKKRQEVTNQTLDRFIRSMERGEGNGRGKTRVN